MNTIQGLLLAAGRSKRFGSDKLLTRLPDGRLMAEASCANLLAVVPVIAVLRPDQNELETHLRKLGAAIVHCPNADEGLSASLKAGIAATSNASGWIVALADMPHIRTDTIREVEAALRAGAPAAAPMHKGQRGHPVGFSSSLKEALMQLSGDQGAKTVLATLGEQVRLVNTDDPGSLHDIDQPEDFGRH